MRAKLPSSSVSPRTASGAAKAGRRRQISRNETGPTVRPDPPNARKSPKVGQPRQSPGSPQKNAKGRLAIRNKSLGSFDNQPSHDRLLLRKRALFRGAKGDSILIEQPLSRSQSRNRLATLPQPQPCVCVPIVGELTPTGSRPLAQGCPRGGKPWGFNRFQPFQPPRGCVR